MPIDAQSEAYAPPRECGHYRCCLHHLPPVSSAKLMIFVFYFSALKDGMVRVPCSATPCRHRAGKRAPRPHQALFYFFLMSFAQLCGLREPFRRCCACVRAGRRQILSGIGRSWQIVAGYSRFQDIKSHSSPIFASHRFCFRCVWSAFCSAFARRLSLFCLLLAIFTSKQSRGAHRG